MLEPAGSKFTLLVPPSDYAQLEADRVRVCKSTCVILGDALGRSRTRTIARPHLPVAFAAQPLTDHEWCRRADVARHSLVKYSGACALLGLLELMTSRSTIHVCNSSLPYLFTLLKMASLDLDGAHNCRTPAHDCWRGVLVCAMLRLAAC